MYATLFALALAVPAADAADATSAVKWQTNYSAARKLGREQDKPLAVFIGSGAMGWKGFIDEGSLTENVQKTLANDFVCVYVDHNQAAGQSLAEQFEIPTGSGLVFSTRDGKGQAFSHMGKMSASEFQSRMSRYAGTTVVSTTESLNDTRTSSYYDPATGKATTTTGAPAVMGAHHGTFGGYGNFGGFGGYSNFGGGCPNCRR